MSEVVSSVERVTDVIAEIVSASQEQSAGIEQINQAISEMDNVTQQNASLVEEAAAAADSLYNQVGNLVCTVSVFQSHADGNHRTAHASCKRHAFATRKNTQYNSCRG